MRLILFLLLRAALIPRAVQTSPGHTAFTTGFLKSFSPKASVRHGFELWSASGPEGTGTRLDGSNGALRAR